MAKDQEIGQARAARVAAAAIVAVAVLWLALQWMGVRMGWNPRTMVFFDLLALAGFSWALVNVYWIWRARRKSED